MTDYQKEFMLDQPFMGYDVKIDPCRGCYYFTVSISADDYNLKHQVFPKPPYTVSELACQKLKEVISEYNLPEVSLTCISKTDHPTHSTGAQHCALRLFTIANCKRFLWSSC
jgi:hypothetical protein